MVGQLYWGVYSMNHEQSTCEPSQDTPKTPADQPVSSECNHELHQLRETVAALKSDMLRERADLENQRKRLVRDLDMARKLANEKLLGELLPVFDSLDAGLTTASTDATAVRDGLELTHKQLLKAAADNGLVVVDPEGSVFNPEFHQAISQVASDTVAAGHVVQVCQKGYMLNGRLLRPALVIVAQTSS